jgi:hypothetical protein
MGTDAIQHRESIDRFYCLARTVKNSKRLTLLEFISICCSMYAGFTKFEYVPKIITKLSNSKQSNKGKVKTHKNTNRQNQSTTGKL